MGKERISRSFAVLQLGQSRARPDLRQFFPITPKLDWFTSQIRQSDDITPTGRSASISRRVYLLYSSRLGGKNLATKTSRLGNARGEMMASNPKVISVWY